MNLTLTIKEVATLTDLTAYTLRYYERIGLIAPIKRATSGQRRYAASDMEWLKFLLRLRATNMPISQMQTFALLRAKGNSTIKKRREMLEQHLQKVHTNMFELKKSAKVLQAKIQHYQALEITSARTNQPTKRKKL